MSINKKEKENILLYPIRKAFSSKYISNCKSLLSNHYIHE